jgi:hypothetical protein
MKKEVIAVLVAAAAGLSAGPATTAAQAPAMRTVMQQKLDDTQRLLRAVVMADFAQIDRGAERLSRITDMEIGSWQTPGQPEYTRRAVEFLSAVQGLREAAKRRNADAAGAHYSALVSSCVQCHAVVGRSRLVSTQ